MGHMIREKATNKQPFCEQEGFTPPWADTPLGRHPPEMATEVGGMHLTGMHSCPSILHFV